MVVLSTLSYFLPIISFLFVFVLIYALLVKTKILGDNNSVALMLSFFLSAFFIFNASLVEFVQVSSAWVVAFFVCLFLIITLLSFTGKWGDLMNKNMGYAVLGILIVIFVVSSSYVFNWAVNFQTVRDWSETRWFGFTLLLVMAGIVSKVLVKK